MCATINLAEATYCASCGARVRLLDEDAPEQEAGDNPYAAAWGTPAGEGAGTAIHADAAGQSPPPAEAGTGSWDWLSSLRASAADAAAEAPAEETAHTPAWRGAGAEDRPAGDLAGEPTAEEDVPDWLRRLRTRIAVESHDEPVLEGRAGASTGGSPAEPASQQPEVWGAEYSLRQRLGAGGRPDEPAGAAPQQPAQTSPAPTADTDDMVPWLQLARDEPAAADQPHGEAGEMLPAPGREALGTAGPPRAFERRQIAEAAQDQDARAREGTPPRDLAMPDWLREAAETRSGEAAGGQPPEWPGGSGNGAMPAAIETAAEPHSWLRGESSGGSFTAQPEEGPGTALPDWLRGDAQAEAAAAAPRPGAQALPSWLSSIKGIEEESAGDAPAQPPGVGPAQAPSAGEFGSAEREAASAGRPAFPAADAPARPPASTETAPARSAAQPPQPAGATELPDWLQELNTPTASIGPTPTSDLPTWLRGEQASQAQAAPGGEIELPPWLRDLADQPPAPVERPQAPRSQPRGGRITGPLQIDDTDLPTWLTESATPPPPAVRPPAVQVPPPPEMNRITPAQTAGPGRQEEAARTMSPSPARGSQRPEEAGPAAPAQRVAPEPARAQQGAPGGPAQAASPPTARPAAPSGPISSAPADAITTSLAAEGMGPAGSGGPAQPATTLFFSEEDLPAWLRELETGEGTATAAQPTTQAGTSVPAPEPRTEPAGLPGWLKNLRSTLDEDVVPPVDLPVVLEQEPVSVAQQAQAVRVRPPREGAVEMLTALMAAPVAAPAVETVPAARRGRFSWLAPDRIVSVLLLLVVALMLALAPFDSGTARAPSTAYGTAFFDTLSQAPASTPVLLVYDWDGSRYAEMSQLSASVTRLLRERGHNIVTASLVPEGSGFAQAITGQVTGAQIDDAIDCDQRAGLYGKEYLHLGYLPGNEAALAALATTGNLAGARADFVCNQQIDTFEILSGVSSLADFGAIVLLSGNDSSMRLWIEQVGTRAGAIPMLLAAPEAVRPSAEPYLQVGGGAPLDGAIFGITGAQELEQRRVEGRPDGQLGRLLHTQSAALYLLALALLAGFFFGAYRWINRTGRQ